MLCRQRENLTAALFLSRWRVSLHLTASIEYMLIGETTWFPIAKSKNYNNPVAWMSCPEGDQGLETAAFPPRDYVLASTLQKSHVPTCEIIKFGPCDKIQKGDSKIGLLTRFLFFPKCQFLLLCPTSMRNHQI